MSKLLILGGTAEGRALACAIAEAHPDMDMMTSLAGATARAKALPGQVRVGGFGGISGLVDYVRTHKITHVIDATHPFATTITTHAVQACLAANVAYLRLERASWDMPTDTDIVFVPDACEAARLVARTSRAAFLTIGRKDLAAFCGFENVKLLVRTLENPEINLENATFIFARPPFGLADEVALMRSHQIDTLVTKASGGDATRAKLDAAAQVGARIIVLRRPPPPDAVRVSSVQEALAWLFKEA